MFKYSFHKVISVLDFVVYVNTTKTGLLRVIQR